MTKRIIVGKALRRNYRELIFVFAAFALMAMVGYFFIGRILRNRLLTGAGDMLYTAEANIRAGLSEAETTLINSYYVVESMVELNASRQDILDYLTITTDWMRRWDQGLLGYYGIYGFINNEFYDSMGFNVSNDYIPHRQLWFQTAIRSGRNVAYTAPYEDVRTGNTIISAVRNIDIKNGEIAGILSIDINISWLMEYMGALKLSPSGYGMLLNRGMMLITHPDNKFAGSLLEDLGKSYAEVSRTLRSGGEVFARRITDTNGDSAIVFIRQIFNGWYVCVITPYSEFYRDLNVSATILILLGISLSLSLCFILLRFYAAKMHADEDNRSKSSFLASMSHEIRTPMNAITGMAELLLRGELSDEARGYARDIKQAGNNLVSIINDILDFSKIEAGKLEIIPVKYMLASLVNDSVNIIRMRIGEKPLRFFTNIEGTIPNNLIGDEVRMRQIFLNLLSNAVKYSDKGHIGLSIMAQKREDKQIWLKIIVADTGKGIKKGDQEKLFGEFVQVDVRKNRGIEGTGLGLAITKRLCLLMGGDITVESEYGRGSAFTAVIPQGIDSPEPFAIVEEPEKKKVLIFERRTVYAQAICWSLEDMKVPYTLVKTPEDFSSAIYREEWFYVFSGYGLYDKVKLFLEQPDSAFYGGKKPHIALMMEWGTEGYIPNVRFMPIPVQSLSIANVLNGKTDSKGYSESSGIIRFTFPSARLLVVDDIATNLKVAEGLLTPYMTTVDTCLSGRRAIEMVKINNYDIVFMDHMMPEMDGIEATSAIRAWEKESKLRKHVPIIALTANAVVGMREMFIQNGLDDFLAKPIDVSKLDEILNHWISKDKRENIIESDKQNRENHSDSELSANQGRNADPLFNIPGVDTPKGITMCGGTEDAYKQVLSLFCKDVEERLPLLQEALKEDDLNMFVTNVHALKSASASIGAAEISNQAAGLEAIGKAGDTAFIRESLPDFIRQLTELIGGINAALKTDKASAQTTQTANADAETIALLRELKLAVSAQKTVEIDRILEELNQKQMDAKTSETLQKISDDVLITEFDSAMKKIDEVLRT
ncbi:MAG: response regulator [Treponema sp.]|jgi:signal transduction histidine kinase/CheY-like chemotaxis protein|nr:response regulator [Treponema sp.]